MPILNWIHRFLHIPELNTLKGLLTLLGTFLGLAYVTTVTYQLAAREPELIVTNQFAFSCLNTEKFFKHAEHNASLSAMRPTRISPALTEELRRLQEQEESLEADETDGEQVFGWTCWTEHDQGNLWRPQVVARLPLTDKQVDALLADTTNYRAPTWPAGAPSMPLHWLRQRTDSEPWPKQPAIVMNKETMLSWLNSLGPNLQIHAKLAYLDSRTTINVLAIENRSPVKVKFQARLKRSDGVGGMGGDYELERRTGGLVGPDRELQAGNWTWSVVRSSGFVLTAEDLELLYDRTPVLSPLTARAAAFCGGGAFAFVVLVNALFGIAAARSRASKTASANQQGEDTEMARGGAT